MWRKVVGFIAGVLVVVCCVLIAAAFGQEQLPLKPRKWKLDPQTFMAGVVPLQKDGGLAFDFPVSPRHDPYATPPRVGYLLKARSWPIEGAFISITFRLEIEGVPTFNSYFDPGSACTTWARARLHFQSGALYSGNENSRWWSYYESADLRGGLNGEPVTLTVPLIPSQWSNTFGRLGNSSSSATAGFYAALRENTWIGVTFGGCFFGHGVNVSGGTVRFVLMDYSIY